MNTDRLPNGRDVAMPLPRRNHSVKYYFADFGIAVHIPADAPSKLVLGDLGRDQEVPELSIMIPYDPFKVDVFIVGNMFRHLLQEVRNG